VEWGFVVAGLVVGFVVGLTGVGGGSLMTPILLWFGINPATAVGTDHKSDHQAGHHKTPFHGVLASCRSNKSAC
jgi:hypothetical protein